MSERPVIVAINGQINPNHGGGSEASVMSVVHNIGQRKAEVSLDFISLPAFADVVKEVAPECANVIAWPFPMSAPVSRIVQGERWVRLRNMMGPLKPLFDEAVYQRRKQTSISKLATAAECDALLDKYDVDVVHFGWPGTFPTGKPFIYEPHDLQHCHYPEFFSADVLRWRDQIYRPACRNAAFIVCGTWWTKNDIMRQYNVPSERVAVIPRASVKARSPISAEREQAIATEYGLPDTYAFYPAMTFVHKNHKRLIEAIGRLRDQGGPRINLICTGRKLQPTYGDIEQLIQKLNLADQVRFLGTVPDDVLTAVYKRASMIVFPSLFEGHSQSLLEGLNMGLPVVGAKQSSIPETVGDAGLLFDAEDVNSIAETLARAAGDPDLMAAKAQAAAKEMERYNWTGAAETFVAVYRKAAGRTLTKAQQNLLAAATRQHF